jgi:hypothetical protein
MCRTVSQRSELCIEHGGSHCEQFSVSNKFQTYFSVHYTNQLTDIGPLCGNAMAVSTDVKIGDCTLLKGLI